MLTDAAGIPAPYEFKKMLFEPTLQLRIVEARHPHRQGTLGRIYLRYPGDTRYVPLGQATDEESQDSAILVCDAPVLVYRQSAWSEAEKTWADFLFGYRLTDGHRFYLADQRALARMASEERVWIGDVVRSTDSARNVWCTLGMQGTRRGNYLCHIDLGAQSLRPIVQLQGVLF